MDPVLWDFLGGEINQSPAQLLSIVSSPSWWKPVQRELGTHEAHPTAAAGTSLPNFGFDHIGTFPTHWGQQVICAVVHVD